MGKLSVSGMAAVKSDRVKRSEALRVLTSIPFDTNNAEQLAALKIYNNKFEYSVNQMYLFQALNQGLMIGGGGWLLGYVLPIPDFAKYFLSMFLYAGVAGFILERFSMNDFYNDLCEMQSLYNWCFKNGEQNYSSSIDNTEKLAQSELQRLIKLIAPLCPVDFMMAWKRETMKPDENIGGWSNVKALGITALSSTFSLFSSPKPGVDLTRLRELKVAIETRELDVSVYRGLDQAVKYFATNTDFRDMIKENVGLLKNMVPSTFVGLSSH